MPNSFIKRYSKKKYFDTFSYRNKSILTNLTLQLTYRCNHECLHCCVVRPAGSNEAQSDEMDTNTIKRLLREACSLGCLYINFTGGEPLLRNDFEEIYIYARKLGLRPVIQTNSTLITLRLAKLFARLSPHGLVKTTLYGMSRRTYADATGVAGSFDAAQRGIHNLLKCRVPLLVYYGVLPCNKHEAGKYVQWIRRELGMKALPIFILFFNSHCSCDRERNEQIKRIRISPEEGVDLLTELTKKNFQNDFLCKKDSVRLPGNALFRCMVGHGTGCISPYGDFQPCYMLTDPRLVYNLKRYSLYEALTLSNAQTKRKKTANPVYLKRCAKCFIHFLCVQCPGHSWVENGCMDKPVEYQCEVAHEKARRLGLITEHERAWLVLNWHQRLKTSVGLRNIRLL
jgi:radical SAM protein with 4Fe4S-binding SPASM domain